MHVIVIVADTIASTHILWYETCAKLHSFHIFFISSNMNIEQCRRIYFVNFSIVLFVIDIAISLRTIYQATLKNRDTNFDKNAQ